MTLRTLKERIVQTLAYEAGGLVIATPVYALVFGVTGAESLILLAALSVAVMTWAPLHNTLFDWIEWHNTGRLASARPARWRLVHALSLELSALIVTCPLVMVLGGYTLPEALAVDFGLTLFYTVYAYVFFLAFDRLRPMEPDPAPQAAE